MTQSEHEKRYKKWANNSKEYKLSKAGYHEYDLLRWIEMINSCFAYNECEKLEDYITGEKKSFYYANLTEQEKRDIMNEHLKYLREQADIVYNTYTDGEGCSYNDLLW